MICFVGQSAKRTKSKWQRDRNQSKTHLCVSSRSRARIKEGAGLGDMTIMGHHDGVAPLLGVWRTVMGIQKTRRRISSGSGWVTRKVVWLCDWEAVVWKKTSGRSVGWSLGGRRDATRRGECAVIAPRRQLTISIFYCHQKRKSLDVGSPSRQIRKFGFPIHIHPSPAKSPNNHNNITDHISSTSDSSSSAVSQPTSRAANGKSSAPSAWPEASAKPHQELGGGRGHGWWMCLVWFATFFRIIKNAIKFLADGKLSYYQCKFFASWQQRLRRRPWYFYSLHTSLEAQLHRQTTPCYPPQTPLLNMTSFAV